MIPVSGWVIFITELWEDLQENMSRPVFSLQISSPTYFLKGFFWTMMIENLMYYCVLVCFKEKSRFYPNFVAMKNTFEICKTYATVSQEQF